MAAETWMDADRAVELGFADSIADGKDAPKAKAWDLSAFEHAPKQKPEESEEKSAQPDREALRRDALARLIPA